MEFSTLTKYVIPLNKIFVGPFPTDFFWCLVFDERFFLLLVLIVIYMVATVLSFGGYLNVRSHFCNALGSIIWIVISVWLWLWNNNSPHRKKKNSFGCVPNGLWACELWLGLQYSYKYLLLFVEDGLESKILFPSCPILIVFVRLFRLLFSLPCVSSLPVHCSDGPRTGAGAGNRGFSNAFPFKVFKRIGQYFLFYSIFYGEFLCWVSPMAQQAI